MRNNRQCQAAGVSAAATAVVVALARGDCLSAIVAILLRPAATIVLV
jgi:hypothetical protein